jgi:hypothetical protein
MRAFAAVFAREIFARRIVFPVAFAAGFMPLVGSLAYGWSKPDAAEGRVLVALVTAMAFAFAFALLFGGSAIAGETSEKRISFFFSRPIPAVAIWGGKLLAVLFLAFVSGVLAILPAFVTSAAAINLDFLRIGGAGRGALGLFLATLLVALGAHAVVTVARLRSPWVALDLLLAPALVLLAAAFLRSLMKDTFANEFSDARGLNVISAAVLLLVAAVFAALLLASFVQVAEGRTDARRAHGAFSVVFFGILGTAVALVGGYAGWRASAKATDLSRVWSGQAAPRGSWVVAGGPLRAWRGGGTFLFDASSGRSIRVHGWNVAFSQDGTRAAWGEPRFKFFERKDNRADLVVADLASGRTFQTGLECATLWSDLALSPNGMRLALRDGKTLSAFDISRPANPKQLAVVNLEGEGRAFTFVDEDTLRMFPRTINAKNQKLGGNYLEIAELSLSSKKTLVTGRFDRETLPFLNLSPDARFFVGTRSLSEEPNGKRALTLHDGRTGLLLTTLADDLRNPHLRFLAGGGFVVAGIGEGSARVLFFEGDRTLARTLGLGPAARVVLGREITPHRIVVAVNSSDKNDDAMRRSWKTISVDAATGVVVPLGDGLVPANSSFWWSGTAVMPTPEAGSPSSRLFFDTDSRLVRLDPATGAQTVLLGRAK